MTPQPFAEPADEPQATLVATCANCGRRILRLDLGGAKWRHDNGAITCAPPDPTFDHHAEGNQS